MTGTMNVVLVPTRRGHPYTQVFMYLINKDFNCQATVAAGVSASTLGTELLGRW